MVYIKISFWGGGRLGAWVGRDGFSRIFQKQRCNHRSSFKAMEMRADIERGRKKKKERKKRETKNKIKIKTQQLQPDQPTRMRS